MTREVLILNEVHRIAHRKSVRLTTEQVAKAIRLVAAGAIVAEGVYNHIVGIKL